MKKTNLHQFNVIYIAENTNLTLFYRESFTDECLEEENITAEDIETRIYEDLNIEVLKIIDNTLILESEAERFITTHNIEDRKNTDYRVFLTRAGDETTYQEIITKNKNITFHRDNDFIDNIFYIEDINTDTVNEFKNHLLNFDEDYLYLKEELKDNEIEFIPTIIWTEKIKISESELKKEKRTISYTSKVKK